MHVIQQNIAGERKRSEAMSGLNAFSNIAVPFIFMTILILGILKSVNVYDVFVEGAKEGLNTTIRIIPNLVGLIVAVGVFRESGAMDVLTYIFSPLCYMVGIPREVLPLVVLRPISGSASLALVADIMKNYGADSYIGRLASTIMGSTETIFYTLTVYFGSIGIKNIKHTLICALIADAAGVLAAVWICKVIFNA